MENITRSIIFQKNSKRGYLFACEYTQHAQQGDSFVTIFDVIYHNEVLVLPVNWHCCKDR